MIVDKGVGESTHGKEATWSAKFFFSRIITVSRVTLKENHLPQLSAMISVASWVGDNIDTGWYRSKKSPCPHTVPVQVSLNHVNPRVGIHPPIAAAKAEPVRTSHEGNIGKWLDTHSQIDIKNSWWCWLCAGKKQLTMHKKLVFPPGHEEQRSSILATCHFSAVVDLEDVPYYSNHTAGLGRTEIWSTHARWKGKLTWSF